MTNNDIIALELELEQDDNDFLDFIENIFLEQDTDSD